MSKYLTHLICKNIIQYYPIGGVDAMSPRHVGHVVFVRNHR